MTDPRTSLAALIEAATSDFLAKGGAVQQLDYSGAPVEDEYGRPMYVAQTMTPVAKKVYGRQGAPDVKMETIDEWTNRIMGTQPEYVPLPFAPREFVPNDEVDKSIATVAAWAKDIKGCRLPLMSIEDTDRYNADRDAFIDTCMSTPGKWPATPKHVTNNYGLATNEEIERLAALRREPAPQYRLTGEVPRTDTIKALRRLRRDAQQWLARLDALPT